MYMFRIIFQKAMFPEWWSHSEKPIRKHCTYYIIIFLFLYWVVPKDNSNNEDIFPILPQEVTWEELYLSLHRQINDNKEQVSTKSLDSRWTSQPTSPRYCMHHEQATEESTKHAGGKGHRGGPALSRQILVPQGSFQGKAAHWPEETYPIIA